VPEPHDLQRFLDAQAGVYGTALAELRTGEKRSHWMWFIFPQLRGLGSSPNAERFGIASLAEARAYLAHPLLGARLRECVGALLELRGASAEEILGFVDAMKLRSCLTLFQAAAPAEASISRALDRYFGAEGDARTLELLGGRAPPLA
jgi:uncharacterized protein (DUF1810 family)